MTNTTNHHRTPEPRRRWTVPWLLPVAWLVSSAAWAVVIVVTDQPAWPLAIWIATTIGPLTAAERRHRRTVGYDADGAAT